MRKLIAYIFSLLILISLVYITKEIIEFSKDIIIINECQTEAVIKKERMLMPVVKISGIQSDPSMRALGLGNVVSSATGFSIEYDPAEDLSTIVTNDHFCRYVMDDFVVVVEDYRKRITNSSGDYMESEIIYTDSELDLCLIKVSGYIKPVIIADYEYNAQLFEKIYIVGGPSGNFPIIIDSYISSIVDREDIFAEEMANGEEDFLLVSEQIFPGHSGSPVYNQYGELIGVIFASMQSYGGIAISHRDIFELLNRYEEEN